MRAVDPAAHAERLKRGGFQERVLVWVAGRNRTTDAIEALGLWTGEDAETITVVDMFTGASATRTFHGAGALLGISSIKHEAGLSVRPVRLSLSPLDPAVVEGVRPYDPRGAEVQIWKRSASPSRGSRATATRPRSRARSPAAKPRSRWRWSRPRGS